MKTIILYESFFGNTRLIAEALVGKGGNLIIPEEGFLVKGEKGPLVNGEPERAASWAEQIVK